MAKLPRRDYQANVIYLGVVKFDSDECSNDLHNNSHNNILAESQTGESHLNRDVYDKVIRELRSHASTPQSCTVFTLEEHGQQWLVNTDANRLTYIVITSPTYPIYVGVECVDDLADLFAKQQGRLCRKNESYNKDNYDSNRHTDNSRKRQGTKKLISKLKQKRHQHHKIQETKRNQSELESLLLRYDDLTGVSKIWKRKKEVEDLTERMKNNISKLLENTANAERMVELSRDLSIQAKVFKKTIRKHNESRKMKTLAKWGTVGMVVGGMGGFLVGGPAGALVVTANSVLIAQAIETGVGAAIGLVAGGMFATGTGCFWDNKFVSLTGIARKLVNY